MAEKQTSKIEREYVIPLREKCRPVPRYKKTPKAVKTVKEFIARHMRVENRDLNKVKIDSYLNEQLWMRGIKKTLHKVKVKAVKEGDIVRVYATDLPAVLDFKKQRLEKREKSAEDAANAVKESKKSMAEKAKDQLKGKKDEKTSEEQEEIIEKEEEKSGVPEEIAEKEAELDVKETEKAEEKKENKDGIDKRIKEEEKSISKEKSDQKEMKEESRKVKKTTNPKRTGENLDEVQKSD